MHDLVAGERVRLHPNRLTSDDAKGAVSPMRQRDPLVRSGDLPEEMRPYARRSAFRAGP